jgi:cellulose biosynthesis protein BcsQ
MITIAIGNQKGGVGKTTTAVTLAHGLALQNYNVLLVDLDPQGQCSSLLGLEQEAGVFNLLVNRPPMGARVLDAGCGAGVPVTRVLEASAATRSAWTSRKRNFGWLANWFKGLALSAKT